VLEGKDLKASIGNAYAYADFVGSQYPDVNQYRDRALEDFRGTENRYAVLLTKYRALTREAPQSETEAVMTETYELLKETADALKSTGDFLAIVEEQAEEQEQAGVPMLDEHQGDIADAQVTTNDSIEQLSSALETLRAAVPAAPTDLRSYELAVAEAEDDVAAAKEELERHEVRAPIAGTIARSDIVPGASVVNGEILATIITEETVARISLSEADVMKVREGDPATISFDGIEGFSLPGTVLAVDPAATVASGNVTFYAIVGFDESDGRVRPGMTVTASIAK
jgi:HlyD family secretion protein